VIRAEHRQLLFVGERVERGDRLERDECRLGESIFMVTVSASPKVCPYTSVKPAGMVMRYSVLASVTPSMTSVL
jgi:hypothetical protein